MDMTGVRYSPSVPGVQDASSVPTEGPTSEDGTRKLSVVLTLFLSLSFNIIMCIVIILLSICMVLKKRRGKPDLRKRSTSGSNLMGGKDEDGGMQDEEIKYQESKDKDSKVEESKYVVVKTSSVPRPSLPHDSKVQYSEIDIRATHKMARSQYAELGLPPTNQLKPSDMDTKTHTPYVTVLPNPSAVTDNSNSEKETADKAAPKVSDASSNLSGEVGVEETTPPGDGTNEDGNGGNENVVQVVKGASSPPKDEGPNCFPAENRLKIRMFEEFLQYLSGVLGLPDDQVRFISLLLMGYPLALVLCHILHPSWTSLHVRHLFSSLSGLTIATLCYGWQVLALVGLVAVGYIILLVAPPQTVHSSRLLYVGMGGYSRPLNKDQEKQKLTSVPSVLEYMSYCFNFHSVLAGPSVTMREHLDFMDGSNFHSAVSTTSSQQSSVGDVA
ncbi:Lysophospholipid acyltransferase 1 [Geodia barretti]|uniref:Lysophospholipid acyltransferase 1 n=1 Tax=Geodia barretti TaxID=519541 RepID=A0AA35X5A6_GEOBA|nr:Lysophospholipid acyltransferase 1 [Geodia barretti]